MRYIPVLSLAVLMACPESPPAPDAGQDVGSSVDAGAAADGGQAPPDVGEPDSGLADVGSSALDAGQADAGPAETCPPGLEGQASLCLSVESAGASPLPPKFSGLLTQDFRNGWQPWDPRYVEFAKRVLPGFLAVGAVYSWDWHSGSIPFSNVEVHTRKAGKYNQTLDFHRVIRGKGYLKIDDYARVAAQLDAKLVIEANVRTSERYQGDQPASIRAYAEHVARQGYPVLYWKLSSEPIYWADENWCDREHRPCTPFHAGGDGYADDMKVYFDAIAEGYAAAGVEVPPRVVHHTEGGHTARQRRFDGVELNPETHELQPWSGAGGIAYYGSLADRVNHPERRKYWGDWGHNWFMGFNTYTPEGGDPISCDTDPEGHWAAYRKHLSDVLAHQNLEAIDNYHLRVNGAEGFDTAPPENLRGNIGSFSVRATTPYTTTMYAAIYAAESMMRWSSHPRMRSAGYFALGSNCMGMMNSGRQPARSAGNIAANATVTDSVANSVAFDYGIFDHLPCLALSLTNRAINLGVERLEHQQHGGLSTAATVVEEATAPARWVPGPEEQVPATHSAVYRGADGVIRLLITNRSDSAHDIDLIHDGRRLTGADLIAGEVISAAEPRFRNYGAGEGGNAPNCVPPRPENHQNGQIQVLDLNQPLQAAPWSVTLLQYRAASDGGSLPAPDSLEVNPGVRRLELNWSAVPGALGYRVLWGTRPGVYTSYSDVQTNAYGLDYLDGIPVYFAVSTQAGSGHSAPSAEVQGQSLPALLSSDDFEGQALSGSWASGCGDGSPWSLAQGRLSAPAGAGPRCALHADSSSADQSVRANILHGGWPDPLGPAQVGLVGRYQDAQTYVVGALRSMNPNGNWIQRAVIEVHHPSLPNGFLQVGTSPNLTALEAEGWFPDALLNGQGEPAYLELELSGRTLRLFAGRGGDRRLLATGLDSFEQAQGQAMVQQPLELETELTGAGRAGVMSQAVAASFADFSVR